MKSKSCSQAHIKILTSFKVLMGCALMILLTFAIMRPTSSGEHPAHAATKGSSASPLNATSLVIPDTVDTPHTLAATYYFLGNGRNAMLMLSNQGPREIEIQPTLFNLRGERFDASPRVLKATTAYPFDIAEWATIAGPSFQEGNLQISYVGKGMEIAGVVQLVQLSHSLSFDEELTEPAVRFLSSRLEGVWWLPSPQATMAVVVSNTRNVPVVVTLSLSGNEPRRTGITTVSLGAHESSTIDLGDLAGGHGVAVPKFGGISITQSGPPGAVIARGMIRNEATGFSSVVDFSDPRQGRSTRIDGAGLRVGRIGTEQLSQIIVARNTDSVPATLDGRIPYTQRNGATGVISLPQVELTAGESKVIDASDAIRKSGIRGIATAGLEFSYSSAPGSMIMSAISISNSENDTFRVLLMDAASLPSSAGTYPWSITDESSTIVYIKNVTNEPQDFIMVVRYGAVTDGYAPRAQTIAGGQTMAIDLLKLRNDQVPDGYGRTLPLDASEGQLHWSASGRTRLSMIGRGEQVSISRGIGMTAACGQPCCGDVFMGSFVSPGSAFGFNGAVTTFTANQQEQDCWGNMFTYPASAPVFSSSNPGVATCNASGTATGVSPGTAIITATWHYFTNYPGGDPQTPQCFNDEYETQAEAVCDIGSLAASVVSPAVPGDGDNTVAGSSFDFRVEARRPDGSRATEVDGNATLGISGGAGSGEVIPSGINMVGGMGTTTINLRRVISTGDVGRSYTSSITFGGGTGTTSGTIKVYFSATMDVERWKNCNFVSCPNLGSYVCMTACNPNGFPQQTEFIALTASACQKDVRIYNPANSRASTSSVHDLGPTTNNAYWLTGNIPAIGGCLSEVLMNSLGIANGCNPNFGQATVLWRFGL